MSNAQLVCSKITFDVAADEDGCLFKHPESGYTIAVEGWEGEYSHIYIVRGGGEELETFFTLQAAVELVSSEISESFKVGEIVGMATTDNTFEILEIDREKCLAKVRRNVKGERVDMTRLRQTVKTSVLKKRA